LGGMNGFTRVDPSMITENKTPPKLFFSDIQVQRAGDKKDTFNLFLSRFSIPSDARQSVIAFSAINYTYPEKVNLVYRIRELNNTWLPVTSKTSVTLFGLHPGTYHLLVKAANEDGVWSNPIELELTFEPKWFQTWWFKALLALAFIAIVYLIYRLRISQLRKEQLIRTRLASDLHDDLGSTLNSVKVYANLALMERNSDKYLVQVKDSVQEAITGIRDMIWVLDDKKDTIEHLISRVDQFALPLCEANGMAYKKEIHPDAAHLHLGQEEKRNLYLIFKESVNNAIKYAEANELCITITANRGKPVMIISDNGRGFNPSDATEGNGLKNMRFRASQIKYKLDISTEAAGSRIRLEKN
jgi:two-component sensor histidine kinase